MRKKSILENKERLLKIISTSKSYASVLKSFGLKPMGSNYRTLKDKILKYNIDTKHFTGQAHNKGKKLGPRRNISEYLSNKVYIKSYSLKNRLFKEGIKQKYCENCKLDKWLDKDIPLELDHIDGNNRNNKLSNLKILCPNCHSLTPTYRNNKRL